MRNLFRTYIFFFLLSVLFGNFNNPAAARETITDINQSKIKAMVVREARALGVPASLALAVAHAESSFNSAAISRKGARGVMQIMPSTAFGEYGIEPNHLWDPRVNIRLGLHYLERLIRKFNGRTDLALSFYNGGSAVGPPSRARVIPATYPYIRKVRHLQKIYRGRLYKSQL
jgi:soluble lytic murein transglycosylase-like protein